MLYILNELRQIGIFFICFKGGLFCVSLTVVHFPACKKDQPVSLAALCQMKSHLAPITNCPLWRSAGLFMFAAPFMVSLCSICPKNDPSREKFTCKQKLQDGGKKRSFQNLNAKWRFSFMLCSFGQASTWMKNG